MEFESELRGGPWRPGGGGGTGGNDMEYDSEAYYFDDFYDSRKGVGNRKKFEKKLRNKQKGFA